MLKLVATYSMPSRVICHNGWILPPHFKNEVKGHILVAGKNTLKEVAFLKQSFMNVNRNTDWKHIRDVANSFDVAILGGEAIFKEGIKWADELALTEVYKDIEGDKFFPEIPVEFNCIGRAPSTVEPELVYVRWKRRQSWQ